MIILGNLRLEKFYIKGLKIKIIDKSLSERRQLEFYNKIYSVQQNHWNRDSFKILDNLFADIIVGNHNFKYHKSFLEIGSGDGRFLDVTFDKLKKLKLELNAIDFCPKAIELSKKRNLSVKFICEEYLKWSKEQEKLNHKFDIIYSNGVFEHFEDIELVLQQTKNIVSSSGFFLMVVPNCLGYDINKDDQREGFRKLNGGSRQIEWHLNLETWRIILENARFKETFFRGSDERFGFIWILK